MAVMCFGVHVIAPIYLASGPPTPTTKELRIEMTIYYFMLNVGRAR